MKLDSDKEMSITSNNSSRLTPGRAGMISTPVKGFVGQSPNGLGSAPGKYVRRLNAMEEELNACKTKCTLLENQLSYFEDWKGKLNMWLLENFGVTIGNVNSGNGDDKSMMSSEQPPNGVQFPVAPMLIPKSEESNSPIASDESTRKTPKTKWKIAAPASKKRNPTVKVPAKKVHNDTVNSSRKKNKGGKMGPMAVSTVTDSSNRAGCSSSVGANPGESSSTNVNETFFIGSSISVEVTRTPSISLERCDNKSEGLLCSSTTSQQIQSTPDPTLPEDQNYVGGDEEDDEDEVSIVYASPPASARTRDFGRMVETAEPFNVNLDNNLFVPETPQHHDDNDPLDMDLYHLETNDPTPCAVCAVVDPEPRNEMIFCDVCNVCVHQACYGVPNLPPGGWKCNPCKLGLRPSEIQCHFCPEFGGALKPIKSPAKCHWAHMICAIWIPEVKTANELTREPIINLNMIPKDRWNLKCSLCKNPRGACIQCQFNKRCVKAFHVTCAMRHGLSMKEVVDPNGTPVLQAYCKGHTYPSTPKKKQRKNAKHGDKSPSKKKRHSSTKEGTHVGEPSKKKLMISSDVDVDAQNGDGNLSHTLFDESQGMQ